MLMNKIIRLFSLVTLLWAALAPTATGQQYLTEGLVAYYPLHGNANDVAGSNNGTAVGAVLGPDRFGIADRAYSFNGTSYIQCPDTGLPSANSARTISLWLNVSSFAGPLGNVTFPFGYGNIGRTDAFYLILDNHHADAPSFAVGQSGGGDFPRWKGPALNQWYHVVVSFDGASVVLYVDGANVAQAPRTYATTLSGNFFIGGNFQASVGPDTFVGNISDVRVYSRALSPDEVVSLYEYERQPCPHRATATAIVHNGFVVGATITDAGCGYTDPPVVIIQGTGTGAEATATVSNGRVTLVTLTDAGSGYSTDTTIHIASPPFMPWLEVGVSQVRVTQHVTLGMNYVLESSADLATWTQVGDQFTANAEVIVQEFDVGTTGRFFRLRQVP